MALETPPGYTAFTPETVAAYLASHPALADRLGGAPADWRAREVGDGNLNLVFIVEGPAGALVVKQALPYVRLVGESWPLPLKRSFFEYNALKRQAAIVPDLLPEIFHYDEANALVAIRYLTPHVILRKELIAGKRFPKLSEDMGRFMAETLFRTSDLCLDASTKKADVALFAGNVALCNITEDLVFTDPYRVAELNRWTPELDAAAARMRADRDARLGVQELHALFLTKAQSLLHGDLHTGSIMVTPSETIVIDPEFAFYGPMGFDIGALLANFLLAVFAQEGHETEPGARGDYEDWLLETAYETWDVFSNVFRRLWHEERHGILYPRSMFEDQGDAVGAERALSAFLADVFSDAVGFAGAKMVRRILGLAHVEDMETIADTSRRSLCEARALACGRELIVGRRQLTSMDAVLDLARAIRREGDLR